MTKKHLTNLLLTVFLFETAFSQSNNLTKIIPDDYSVTNDMLVDKISDNSSHKLKSGEIFSLDKVWFTNDTLKQTIVFELYTDYHRLHIFHFYNNDIPKDLIKEMELYVSKGKFENIFDSASFRQKQNYLPSFIQSAFKINRSYFTTLKGFNLGDSKVKVINVYGKPDKSSILNNIEKCEWKFEGDYIESEEIHPKLKTNKPIANNSFGYSVTMFFRADKILAMLLSNDIP